MTNIPVSPQPVPAAHVPAPFPRKWVALGVAVLGVLGVSAVAGFVFLVRGMIMSSGGYEEGVAYLKNHPEVRASLGEPIEEGFMPRGNVNTGGLESTARLTITLRGPAGEGKAFVVARAINDHWNLEQVEWIVGERQLALLPRAVLSSAQPMAR